MILLPCSQQNINHFSLYIAYIVSVKSHKLIKTYLTQLEQVYVLSLAKLKQNKTLRNFKI